jgi:hypothetical protein
MLFLRRQVRHSVGMKDDESTRAGPVSRRWFLRTGLVVATGAAAAPAVAAAGGAAVPAGDIEQLIAERLRDPAPDFERHLLPEMRERVRRIPDFAALMRGSRERGLQRLRRADLPVQVKRLMLDLELENVLHEVTTTMEHFIGVYELMRSWGSERPAAYTGLFHAIYGTQFNPIQVLDPMRPAARRRLCAAVGPVAERHAWLYGRLDVNDWTARAAAGRDLQEARDFATGAPLSLSRTEVPVLAEALVANGYEPYLVVGDESLLRRLRQFAPFAPHLSTGARAVVPA